MKWILLAIGAFILYWMFRLLNREQPTVQYLPTPAEKPVPASAQGEPIFALRSPMSFEEFYNRYYAASNIDRDFVAKVRQLVSKTGGIPEEQLRPEDRLDQLPKHTLYRGIQFVQRMLDAGVQRQAQEKGIPPVEFHLETIDDLIRQLEPHHLEAFKTHDLHTNS